MSDQPPGPPEWQWTPPPSPSQGSEPPTPNAPQPPAVGPAAQQWQQPHPPTDIGHGQPPYGQPPYGQPPAPTAYLEQRPGIIPLRPLQMGDIYAGVTNAIRGNLAATLGLSLVVTLIFVLPGTALALFIARSSSLDDALNGNELAGVQDSLAANFTGVFQSFGTFLLSAFMAFVIGRGAIGERVSPAQTWAGTKGKLWAVLGGVVLTGFAFVLPGLILVGVPVILGAVTDSTGWFVVAGFGFLATLVCAVLLWVRLAFVSPSIVLEKVGPIAGMKRSWALSAAYFWRIFGIRLLASVGITMVSGMLAAPLGLVLGALGSASGAEASAMATATIVVSALTNILVGTLTGPFLAGLDALLYVDTRIRKEALDVQLMTAAAATR